MSTPPVAGPHEGERRKSLGKYVKRMSSVFKREKPSKNPSGVSNDAATSGNEQQLEAPRTGVISHEVATQPATQEPAKAASIKQEDSTEVSVAA